MAQLQVPCIQPPKLSFAEIAARPVQRTNTSSPTAPKLAEKLHDTRHAPTKKLLSMNKSANDGYEDATQNTSTPPTTTTTIVCIEGLSLVHASPTDSGSPRHADSGDSYEEDRSQVSSSSLNKPHSFDTKSMASVTTFAMDDKESIRPDDSASVRATEEDQAQPFLSRNSSYHRETNPEPNRTTKSQAVSVVIPGRRFPTLVNPPRFGNLPASPVRESLELESKLSPVPIFSPDEPRSFRTTVPIVPDDKLLEALASPKDRLPLLQLEEKIIAFVVNHDLDTLDFPPQNPFTRLLTHRLADYYSLAHHVSEDSSSVRLFRTGYASLPPPLAQLARAIPLSSGSGNQAMAVKIMRRQQAGRRQFSPSISTAPSSSAPSKTTSENGAETTSEESLVSPLDSTPARERARMTFEEREAHYKVVRERIFADTAEANVSESATSTGVNSASISRSSSPSGNKKKTKRHKQPKDDSFDSRSAFVPSFVPSQPYYGQFVDPSLVGNARTSPGMYDGNVYGGSPPQAHYGMPMEPPALRMAAPFVPSSHQAFNNYDWQLPQHPHNVYPAYPDASVYQHAMSVTMVDPMAPPISSTADWYPQQYPLFTPPSTFMPPIVQGPNPYYHNSVQPIGPSISAFNVPPSPLNHGSGQHDQSLSRHKSLFNPQTRSFIPDNNASRGFSKQKARPNTRPVSTATIDVASSTFSHASAIKEDSLRMKYGTPPSLPKKPPPPEGKVRNEMGTGGEGSGGH